MSYWICDKDQDCIDCPKHFPEETCEHWIKVEPVKDIHTKADRIRFATDEELAKKISETIDCGVCKDIMQSDNCPAEKGWRKDTRLSLCEIFWLNWLQQEVNNGD